MGIYSRALEELDEGTYDKDLWAHCYANCEGDEPKARALYVKMRSKEESEFLQVIAEKTRELQAEHEEQMVLDREEIERHQYTHQMWKEHVTYKEKVQFHLALWASGLLMAVLYWFGVVKPWHAEGPSIFSYIIWVPFHLIFLGVYFRAGHALSDLIIRQKNLFHGAYVLWHWDEPAEVAITHRRIGFVAIVAVIIHFIFTTT